MKETSIIMVLTVLCALVPVRSYAKAEILPKPLEKEVIQLIDDMGPDAWEEGDVEAKIDEVLYDQATRTVSVIYETRTLDSHEAYQKQKPIRVSGIRSLDEIVEQAPNGYRSLNLKIAYAILDVI